MRLLCRNVGDCTVFVPYRPTGGWGCPWVRLLLLLLGGLVWLRVRHVLRVLLGACCGERMLWCCAQRVLCLLLPGMGLKVRSRCSSARLSTWKCN